MTDSEQILSKLNDVEKIEGQLIAGIDKLLVSINQFIENDVKKTDDTLKWAQEFHRMLIDEYAAGAQGKIFALVFLDVKSGTRRLVQVVASDMEKAFQIARDKIISVDSTIDTTDWVLELVSKQVVPFDKDNKILDKVEAEMKFDRPLEVYINDLRLVHDKFCSTTSQKNVVNNLIEKIKKIHAGSANRS